MKYSFLLVLFFMLQLNLSGQNAFDYSLQLEPVNIPNLPGLHSYAYGQHDGKWLIIGGRKDGIHARQPFNAFPNSQNNTDIFVVDIETEEFWSSSINGLSANLKEQLQATNLNFYQEVDTLYLIGGYAFSATLNDHTTFANLTTIQVSELIDDIINGNPIASNFKQINDDIFAVTGGQLEKIGNTFYLVGGHRFEGRYNPMNHPTFIQSYTNQIRKFTIDNSGSQLSFSNYATITDPIHLRRRDFNLLPQIFPDGSEGFTISSGVFQINADLPFLYPVDITENGYEAITTFNQYLSNYHCPNVSLYDSSANEMHSIFFGGMSQYYYENGNLIQDDLVPFVKTISRLTRLADGTLEEFKMPIDMPDLKGSGAEFIMNESTPHYTSEIIKLNEISEDTTLIGYIYGGILSPSLNPFSINQTGLTSADNAIYRVKIIKNSTTTVQAINGENPYELKVYPNPTADEIILEFSREASSIDYFFITTLNGQIVDEGKLLSQKTGLNKFRLNIGEIAPQNLFVTVIIDDKYYLTEKIMKNK